MRTALEKSHYLVRVKLHLKGEHFPEPFKIWKMLQLCENTLAKVQHEKHLSDEKRNDNLVYLKESTIDILEVRQFFAEGHPSTLKDV